MAEEDPSDPATSPSSSPAGDFAAFAVTYRVLTKKYDVQIGPKFKASIIFSTVHW